MRQPTEMKGGFLGPNNSKAKIVTLFIKGMVAPVCACTFVFLKVLFGIEYFKLLECFDVIVL